MGTQRKSRNYEDFVEKFKARHTTDDCFTPANIYDCVVAFVGRRFGVKPCDIVRPFFPGKDFTKEEYPAGCVVVDNPPFSICAKIVQHYLDRGIRFFLFCPGLSPFVLRRNEASFIRLLDCGTALYGGGFLLSRRAMKRRKVAEKKAKRTAAKEAEAKYLTLELSGRERKMQKDLN